MKTHIVHDTNFDGVLYERHSSNAVNPDGQDENSWTSHLYGHGGDDTFVAAAEPHLGDDLPDDFFYGGSGSDTVDYSGAAASVSVNLSIGEAWRTSGHHVANNTSPKDYLFSIENVIGSAYDDEITGSNWANRLYGGDGDDWIAGFGGDDTLIGGGGDDTIYGGHGIDNIYGDAGYNILYGGFGNDIIVLGEQGEAYGEEGEDLITGGNLADHIDGGGSRDILHGNGGNDTIIGGSGSDDLFGGNGNDSLEGGAGDDLVDGGSGADTAVFKTSETVVVALGEGLGAGYASTVALGFDTLVSIENVTTGSGNDIVDGNSQGNTIIAGAGVDVVRGHGGADTIYGGKGGDTIHGGSGGDSILGEDGDDYLYGDEGVDLIAGGKGHDRLDGGEHNDIMDGGSGNDTMRGGHGADTMTGGWGSEKYLYMAGDYGLDTITDFSLGVDKFAFGAGFLADQPVSGGSYWGRVMATGSGVGTYVHADTPDGWTAIAHLVNVNHLAVNSAILDGSLFAEVELTEGAGDGPGGIQTPDADTDPRPVGRPDPVVNPDVVFGAGEYANAARSDMFDIQPASGRGGEAGDPVMPMFEGFELHDVQTWGRLGMKD